jgi:PAS domain S-box-containing protein
MDPLDVRRLIQQMPGLFLLLEPGEPYRIVAASDEYLRATGATADIVGKPLFEALPDNPDAPDAHGVRNLRASLEQVRATRAPHRMATQRHDVPRRQGDRVVFEERYWAPINAPLLDGDGTVAYLVHRVEDASAKANSAAVGILESITEGFFTLDRNWRFAYVNREAHRILSRVQGDLAGKVLWHEYPGLEGTEFERNYRHTMEQREKTSFTSYYPRHDAWYEVTAFPAPEGLSVYFRNVTARRKLEAAGAQFSAESERLRRMYETALDSTPDFFYVFDLNHRAVYANDALRRVWGVEDVRGKVWMDLGYEQWHADLHDREIDQVIRTRAPIRGEIPFTGTNGRRVYDYIFAPVFGQGGAVVAVAGVTRDVTERQAAEQAVRDQAGRLAESDRAKDEFLATLSHELRNPLAPLRNALALLHRDGVDARLAPVHAMMRRQVDHLVRLVDDLLELSRISRGTLSLRNERLDVAGVIRNAVETSEPLMRSRNHALTVELPPAPMWTDGDPVRLAQILSNLLDNAAKYTEDGGNIRVRAWQEDGVAAIGVRDDGVGIAPEALPRMFEMFSRGDRDRARTQGGLGIGLALSRKLAQMHGGTLEAHSDGPGLGSEFTLRVPLAEAEAGGDDLPASAPGDLSGVRVLVVDDNHDAGDSLRMLLELMGAEVRVARDGAEALATFASYRPPAVLLDIGMPGMNGYEVARALRDRHPDAAPLLVALTGWGQDEDRRRARDAGFDHHLVKPAMIETLQPLLESVKRTRRAGG